MTRTFANLRLKQQLPARLIDLREMSVMAEESKLSSESEFMSSRRLTSLFDFSPSSEWILFQEKAKRATQERCELKEQLRGNEIIQIDTETV